MKRLFPFLLVFLFIIPVFADESEQVIDDPVSDILSAVDGLFSDTVSLTDDEELTDDSVSLPNNITNNNVFVSTPQFSMSELSTAFYEAILEAENSQINEYSEISDVSIQPLWTGDSSSTVIPSGTLRSVLNSVIGPYSPVVVQYQYTNGTNTQYLREILPDYQWMISAAIFALVLYCVFRLWGAILCKR